MIQASDLARSGCKYLGTPYSQMDCQAFWEKMLADCGIKKDLGGSNSWYRFMMEHGWCGTPEECKKRFGSIPAGAALFIWEPVSEKTPEKFRHDGIGDLTHMGDYTALSGDEMVKIAEEAGVTKAGEYNFGNGAIHSSSSRGHVCTSKFAGKSISGGWNRVGLWDQIDYGETINAILGGHEIDIDKDIPPEPDTEKTAIVSAANGIPVKMRQSKDSKSKSYGIWDTIPCGSVVDVLESGEKWSKIRYRGKVGYMMSEFLVPAGNEFTAHIPHLTEDQAKALLSRYPGSWMVSEGA